MKKRRRKEVTLVEMMIVMFLIAMITGVIAVNYTGSLEEGKAFKTQSGIEKLRTVLDLHLAVHPDDLEHIDTQWETIVMSSPLVKNGEEAKKDGWGIPYIVRKSSEDQQTFEIISEKYKSYQMGKGKGGLFSS